MSSKNHFLLRKKSDTPIFFLYYPLVLSKLLIPWIFWTITTWRKYEKFQDVYLLSKFSDSSSCGSGNMSICPKSCDQMAIKSPTPGEECPLDSSNKTLQLSFDKSLFLLYIYFPWVSFHGTSIQLYIVT